MADWSAQQYLKFEDERTRPARDLLAQVPLASARKVYDLGCGPGNSTELLVARFPDAEIIGVDSSPDMLRQARERLPQCEFVQADLTHWSAPDDADLLYSNATFQWVPDHLTVLKRLLGRAEAGRRARGADARQHQRALACLDARSGARAAICEADCACGVRARGPALPRRLLRCAQAALCPASTSGTHIISTRWPDRRPSPNGSRARRCGLLSIR